MGKLAQYRFLKKVQKMLNTPVKSEEIGRHESNPNHSLRRIQVNEIASMLLQQISRIENVQQKDCYAIADDETRDAIGETFIDLAVAFAELDLAILFTEAEKAIRRQKLARLGPNTRRGSSCSNEEKAAHRRLPIQDWQLESKRKQRKVSRIETTIRDLGLNVNDVRCTQILSEKKEVVAASEAVITAGARLCRETYMELESMFGVGQGTTIV